jgi:exodeoxyribonuclease VII small subunit
MSKDINYATLRHELDVLLEKLQSDDVEIDEALKLYERGVEITKQLENYLESAENTIQKIKSSLEA